MRYLVQHATLHGRHTDDFATEHEATTRVAELEALGKRDVVWFASETWETSTHSGICANCGTPSDWADSCSQCGEAA